MYTIVRNSKTMYVAAQESFLLGNGVLQKVWDILEILNQDTEGALTHVSMKKKEPLWRRASVVDTQGQEKKDSFKSEIFGTIVTNPRKLRGVRLELLLFEESGSFPRLITTYNQSEALVTVSGKKTGIRILWGKKINFHKDIILNH